MYFCYFVIISPQKRAWPFNWRNLNPQHPKMLCAKFNYNWPCSSGREDFLISSKYFCYFKIISTWIGFWRKRSKCEKFYKDRWKTEDRWSEKLTWAFSSGELKTYMNFQPMLEKRNLYKGNIILPWICHL